MRNIDFEKALELEKEDKIKIFAPDNIKRDIPINLKWIVNWNELKDEYYDFPLIKLFSTFDFRIEYHNSNENSWSYIYGKKI